MQGPKNVGKLSAPGVVLLIYLEPQEPQMKVGCPVCPADTYAKLESVDRVRDSGCTCPLAVMAQLH